MRKDFSRAAMKSFIDAAQKGMNAAYEGAAFIAEAIKHQGTELLGGVSMSVQEALNNSREEPVPIPVRTFDQ